MDGTSYDNYNPMIWRFGEKNIENGIYMAVTDNPGGMQFNITDLSTKGEKFIIIFLISMMIFLPLTENRHQINDCLSQ